MAQLNELKKELRFNIEFLQLIQTLKNIAASQYHLLEKEKERFDAFMLAFVDFFRVVNLVGVDNPLVAGGGDVLGIVVVTSDSGFMGGLNAGVIEDARRERGDLPDERVRWIVIGEKGAAHFLDHNLTFKFFKGINQDTRYEQALEIRDYIVGEVVARRIGRVSLVYPHPVSFTQQTIQTIRILPCADLFDRSAPAEAERVPEPMPANPLLRAAREVLVESSFDDMVRYLSEVWVASRLYEVFEDSKLSEYAARAMHLEGSVQKLEKDLKQLRHRCFRASHEMVDKGMRESFSSRKKKKKPAA
jgi:ATP synthase F1 gamma subunit